MKDILTQEFIENEIEAILAQNISDKEILEQLEDYMKKLEEIGDQEHMISWIEEVLEYEINKCKYCSDRGCRECLE